MTDKITIARNVLQQSLDALEASQEFTLASADGKVRHGWGNQLDDAEDAITALREALAAPRSQPAQDAVDADMPLDKDALAAARDAAQAAAWAAAATQDAAWATAWGAARSAQAAELRRGCAEIDEQKGKP